MPKVYLDSADEQLDILCKYIRGEMVAQNISLEEMGEELNVTRQTMSTRLRTKTFSVKDLLRIFKKLNTSEETISRLMRGI